MVNDLNKPAEGSVAPVTVANIWTHVTVVLTTVAAIIPVVLGVLVQLQALPNLPTNVMAWIASAVAVLTALVVILGKLGYLGPQKITPTAAAKVIVSDVNEVK